MQRKLINFVAQNLKLYNQFCYVGHSCLACTIAHFWQIFSHPSQELGINRMGGVEAQYSRTRTTDTHWASFKEIWNFGLMWQTKYASVVPKNLVVGVDFWLCSEGNFLTGRPQSVTKRMSSSTYNIDKLFFINKLLTNKSFFVHFMLYINCFCSYLCRSGM